MLHRKRSWSISPVDTAETLAEKLTQSTWCGCNGFRLGKYLFVNDSTSPDGAQEYGVLQPVGENFAQIESLTFSWMTPVQALDIIRRVQAGEFDREQYDLITAERLDVRLTKKSGLHPAFYNAGAHVQEVFDRLGAFDAINVAPGTGHPDEVVQAAIDLTDVFRNPQILYFHLSSIVAAGSSPEIARFVVYSLLCAASQTERNHPVFLVIDEFQRMVAKNVEALLQLARSMGIGVILANQSMQDLGELIPSIEANCRYRQWFSVSSLDDRERLLKAAGETVEQFTTLSWGSSPSGSTSSMTVSEQVMNRFSVNDIALASDHEMQSIVTIARGKGYAQFGGLPVIITSDYHITAKEYERRKQLAWPAPTTGTYIPREHQQAAPPKQSLPGPVVTTEIINALPFDGPPPLIVPGEKSPKKPSRKGGTP